MISVYGLKTCDTCRKALKSLTGAGYDAQLVDLRETPPDRATLDRFAARFGDALVNRRSTTWRGLSEAERAGDPVELIAAHPAVMKRPVIEADDTLYLGWGAEVRDALT